MLPRMATTNRALRALLGLVLALALVAVTGCAMGGAPAGGGTLKRVLDRGYLIVGTGSTNAPWHYKDDEGRLVGMDIAMGHILATALFDDPSKVQFVEQSPDARIPNLLSDKVDITLQFMTVSPLRMQQVAFTVPYYTEGIGLILPKEGQYKNYAELEKAVADGKTVRVAILQNVDGATTVQELLPGAKDDQYQDQGLVYQALDSKRADAGAVDLSSIQFLVKRQPDRYVDSGIKAHPQNYAAALRPDDQQWINFVDGVFLDAMTGATYAEYNKAYEQYFGVKLGSPQYGKPRQFTSD